MDATFKLPVLLAYPYMKGEATLAILRQYRGAYRLIVDSGAFTAWRSGKPIDLDAYCRFLDSIEDLRPFNAVQLDVFGDPVATRRNFITMKGRGYDVMPVFTRGDSLDALDELYSVAPYVMFGGITTGKANRAYVNAFMRRNAGRPVHLLGFTDLDYIKTYRPTSVDASSWRSAHRWGSLACYVGMGKTVKIDRTKFVDKPDDDIIEALRRNGATSDMIAALGKQAAWRNTGKFIRGHVESTAAFVSTLAAISQAADIERGTGTVYYLACPGGTHLRDLLRAFSHWRTHSGYAGRGSTQEPRVGRNELPDRVRPDSP